MRTTIGLSLVLALVTATPTTKQDHAAHHDPAPDVKAGPASATAGGHLSAQRRRPALAPAAPQRIAEAAPHQTIARREPHATRHGIAPVSARRQARHAQHRRGLAALPPEDRYVGPLRPIGRREVGRAAWYGTRLLGDRTASGERLDAIHATAAHRSLPLHSLVRITNLANGRSVVAEINDRGPASHSLLIDVSPRTARELHMIRQGIAPVVVVPVVAVGRRPD
ncbi:MAG TPA: septal ring lytic transglycosylase RlpA family protein [Stellaceae bacterium]|nr:septal ring lytic transglycosylase RlpA family protein [Stellaceae bacterium]